MPRRARGRVRRALISRSRALRRRLAAGRRVAVAATRSLRRNATVEDSLAGADALDRLGRHRLAVRVLDAAERRHGAVGVITQRRRTIRGYVGSVSAHTVAEIASRAGSRPVRVQELTVEPVPGGMSYATVAIVRHVVAAGEVTFIRKSMHTDQGREAEVYGSGLLDSGGCCWRAPNLLGLVRQDDRWHLFLEDLAGFRRPRRGSDFVRVARGLGELNGLGPEEFQAHAQLDRRRLPGLAPFEPGLRTCARHLGGGSGRRLLTTYRAVRARDRELADRYHRLPVVLCHGDAHAGNIRIDPERPDRVVLFDWSSVCLGPVGSDLGRLASVPYFTAHGGRVDPDACLDAYRDQYPDAPEHDLLRSYRTNLVYYSWRWWARRRDPELLRRADVRRVCEAAEQLLATDDS